MPLFHNHYLDPRPTPLFMIVLMLNSSKKHKTVRVKHSLPDLVSLPTKQFL